MQPIQRLRCIVQAIAEEKRPSMRKGTHEPSATGNNTGRTAILVFADQGPLCFPASNAICSGTPAQGETAGLLEDLIQPLALAEAQEQIDPIAAQPDLQGVERLCLMVCQIRMVRGDSDSLVE
jgi:hypothetical protein